ncbi:LANO_0G10660g1_1 [Lachancea nothofagi CBS 11611]|uniref:SWI5-dependent HO expression protein 3 n=1 Tax=Lachancea nothofagi CBS 11611 TaxID=1266666 RepID=A0A1G4KJ83_9SACH|nr:LANO_0G10660g1_1 [Lachancea nothofagi CBS 11611]
MGTSNDELLGARLNSPVRMSPSKLSMNHGTFMANIQNGNSPTKGGSPGVSSSTRVIEALHAQIDNLTRTNLELTVQSNNLLTRLETATNNHSKHLESMSTLKHENDNLNLMLSRKERRVRDLEQQAAQLRNSYEEAALNNKTMHSKIQNYNQRETNLEQNLQQVQVQYDALLDGQRRYRDQYSREIQELKDQLQSFRRDQGTYVTETLQTLLENHSSLQTRIDEYANKYQKLASVEQEHRDLLNYECESMRSHLDLPKWDQLYQESRNLVIDYAEKANVTLPTSFLSQHSQSNGRPGAKSPPIPQNGHHNGFTNAFSPAVTPSSTFVNPQQIRVPKQRNSSSSAKRSSFYGSNVSIAGSPVPGIKQSPGSPAIASSATLPGVRRSSSIRSSSSSRNSSGELSSSDTNNSSSKPYSKPFSGYKKRGRRHRPQIRQTTSHLANNCLYYTCTHV